MPPPAGPRPLAGGVGRPTPGRRGALTNLQRSVLGGAAFFAEKKEQREQQADQRQPAEQPHARRVAGRVCGARREQIIGAADGRGHHKHEDLLQQGHKRVRGAQAFLFNQVGHRRPQDGRDEREGDSQKRHRQVQRHAAAGQKEVDRRDERRPEQKPQRAVAEAVDQQSKQRRRHHRHHRQVAEQRSRRLARDAVRFNEELGGKGLKGEDRSVERHAQSGHQPVRSAKAEHLTERQPVRGCAFIVGNDLPRNPAFNVISLTTLSTPHLGSALADLAIATEASGIALFGFTVKEMRDLGLSDGGTPNLTTFFTAGFNPPLPGTADYRMLGGDTDLNGDGRIVSAPVDEYSSARSENSTLTSIFTSPPITIGSTTITGPQKADTLATLFHQFLSTVSSVSVLSTTILIPPFPLLVTITLPVPTFAAAPAPNDLLVTLGSANGGPAPFISAAPLSSFTLAAGRDHASIANAGVAAIVIPQLIITDLTRGDLK